ncbi:MAG: hypothetical protein AAFN74_15320 [Myxococcota bacterium]
MRNRKLRKCTANSNERSDVLTPHRMQCQRIRKYRPYGDQRPSLCTDYRVRY